MSVFVVRMSILFTDYRYLVAQECFDYTLSEFIEDDNQSALIDFHCPTEKKSLTIYSKSQDFSSDIVSSLVLASNLPTTCSSSFQLTSRGK